MANALTRMWINQPSTLQAHHVLHGTKVLAEPEGENLMRIYFTAGEVISQQISKTALSNGWLPLPTSESEVPLKAEVVEVVTGLHKALGRMLEKFDPDSSEAEWLSHSNELVRELTGHDIAPNKVTYEG
jgi:hypothetical protein